MYPPDGSTSSTVFTRVEQSYIHSLSPTALRAYAATRSFANGHGRVTHVPQQRMAARAGIGRTQYIKGLREAEKAGAVVLQHPAPGRVCYTFTKTDSRFAAVPNTVLTDALVNLSGRDLQVLLAMYLHVRTDDGVTWVGAGHLAQALNMNKSNLFRSLRNIQAADLATRCDDVNCPAPKPHWHLPTHRGVSQTEQPTESGCSAYDTSGVSPAEQGGCHQPNRGGVTGRTVLKTKGKTRGEDQGTHELRSYRERTVMGRRRDDEVYGGEGLWGEPVADQAVLAAEFRKAVYRVKPGIQFRDYEHATLLKWFRERIEGGWDETTCRTAISRFTEDADLERALSDNRPHIAFFSFVRRYEGSFTETTSTRMREVEQKRDTEVRQRLRDLEERRRQRRAENDRYEA